MKLFLASLALGLLVTAVPNAEATTILYDQNFESPTGFVNDGGDVNIFRTVNELYGNQPPGFTFGQAFTVETLLITGTQAFGTGYSDPSGLGGNYALGMLGTVQNDLLGLAFNVGSDDFLNFSLDISSIDLSVFGGPFNPIGGLVPVFQFTLFDNPSGATGTGSGTILDSQQASGTASARSVFDWTAVLLALDATGNTNGNVILQIDLLTGMYASMDNFRIASSDTPGDIGGIAPAVPFQNPPHCFSCARAWLEWVCVGIGIGTRHSRHAWFAPMTEIRSVVGYSVVGPPTPDDLRPSAC